MQQLLMACPACRRQYDVTGMQKGEKVRCQCGELMRVPDRPSHEARMIHCASCGGKLREGASSCEYCGSEVSLSDRDMGPACPECFARLPAGARFCSECGVRIDPQALRAVRSEASCPRCKGSMVIRETPRGHYTECSSCGGIWLDARFFEKVIEEKDGAALQKVFRSRPTNGSPRESAPETVRYIPCPVCGNLMHRKNFGGCSGVVIDWCKGHGFWFDAFELEKVIAFVQSGGLDKARKLEIDKARRQLARIERQKKRTVAVGGGMGMQGNYSAEPGFDLVDAFSFLLRRFF